MPKDRKLKAALDRHKGVDHKLEHQKKLQKEARKRKGQTREQKLDIGEVEEAVASAEEDDEAQTLARVSEQLQNEHLAARDAQLAEKLGGEADGWETDGSDDVEIEDEGGITLGTIDDESESDSEIEAAFSNTKIISNGLNGNANGDEDEDEDIPLSDIDSLDSDAQADIVPYQRLTINNTAALQRSLKSFALPSNLPFSAAQSITSSEPVVIADVEDDLNRELALYRQSLDAVAEAREKLKKEGAPFSRPTDYFAEMVKSEEQMGKVRQKLVDEAARKKASADARRQRDLKKFGKAVQVAKLQERQKQKKDTLDRISTLKRKRQGAELTNANEDDMFDVALEDAADTARSDRMARKANGAAGAQHRKRQKKDEKFGFGGKKRFAKSNDAKSTGDLRDYSVKKMKGTKPGKPRPGKSKRAKMR